MQNDGETGVDCGGPCQACPTCVDGMQNDGETGVDCGGPCPSCTPIVTQQPPSVPWSTIVLAVVTAILLLSVVLLYSKLKPKRPTIPPTVDLPLRQQRLLEAQKYVLHKLHTGAPRTEIEEALTSKGWSTDIINKMIKLENYIRLGHSKGHSYDVIRQSLRRVGWLPEVVDEIISYCEATRKF
jgi:hypothetical protein